MGFSLDQIREILHRRDLDTRRVIELHIARLRQQIAMQQDLCSRLEAIVSRHEWADVDEFIKAIEVMTMFEKYYTREQLDTLQKRATELGEAHIREVEAEWPRLIAEVRSEMQRGTDPKDSRVQALAKRWMELVNEFTGGDPGIERSLRTIYQNEPQLAAQQSLDAKVFDYVRRALA